MSRADKVLLLVVIALLPALYLSAWQNRQAGDSIVVWSEHHGSKTYDLEQDASISIKGRLGMSRIEISNGKARFIHSPCKGKLCIQHGWVQHQGDFVACLPNRVSVEVSSGKQRFDAINF